MSKEITALPSAVLMADGTTKELNTFSSKEKSEWNERLCGRIGTGIKEHFSDKAEDWNTFAEKLTS